METTFSKAIGDIVYYIDGNNCIHKTCVTQAKIETILNKHNEIVVREFYTVKGRGFNDWIHISLLFESSHQAGVYLATKVIED